VASGEKAGRMHEMPRAATYAIIKKKLGSADAEFHASVWLFS
jgi:hypothetical protein